MITIEGLSKTYAGTGRPALNDIALQIPKGAIYGILGRSGAGKSTLIRCLNLLERPTSGRILVNGQDITQLNKAALRDYRLRTGMIFQHFNLLHARTVADNVAVPLEIAGVPRAAREARVRELLELVDLSEKAAAFPSQLSGGQKQRVGIARALAARPEVLLCDEATSALDPETTASVLALLADINQRLNLTIVLITHQLEVVKTICDHAALLEQGEIVESGKLADLLVTPWSRLRQSLLHDPQAEQEFLTRHGVQGEAIMRSSMSWEDLWPLLLDGTLDTLYMVGTGGPVYGADRAAHRRAVIYFPRQRAGADAETERAVRRGDQHRQVAAVYRTADRPDPLYPPDRRHHAGQHRRHRAGNHRRLSVLCPSDGKRARRGGLREN